MRWRRVRRDDARPSKGEMSVENAVANVNWPGGNFRVF